MKLFLVLNLFLISISLQAQTYNRETNNNTVYSDSSAKVKIDSIYSLLNRGENFSSVALKYSQDPGSYKQGGQLQNHSLNDYVDEYKSALIKLKINEISKPFRSGFGYHIVQLISKKDNMYVSRHILLRVD